MSAKDPDPGPSGSTVEADQMREEHLRELGTMLVGIAHELNTPLGVVISTMDGMQRCHQKLREVANKPALEAGDQERLRAILDHMESGKPVLKEGLKRMEALVRELRLSGRSGEGTSHEPVSIIDVLEGNLVLLHYQLKQGIDVERQFEARPVVQAHPIFLAQAFLNLMRNAIQAMDGQGTLSLTVRERDDGVEVVVADTGHGIPEAVLAKLFRCDVTTKDSGEGTGVGLLICQRIITKHGGRITAANGPNGGAVFTVTLPAA